MIIIINIAITWRCYDERLIITRCVREKFRAVIITAPDGAMIQKLNW